MSKSKIGYFKKENHLDVPVDMKMGRVPRPQDISYYAKQNNKASKVEYHESDRLEVKQVIRNKPGIRLAIRGLLINKQVDKDPGLVLPQNANSTDVPLIGEHVNVVERDGIVYFTTIVNRKGSLNENSIPGVVGEYTPNTKYGKNFKRTEVKPIKLKESSILREGRFGEAIHFDGSNNEPTIKISTQNKSTTEEPYREENPDDRNTSSIYLTSGGDDEGKKVLIQSDGIFIKGREEVRIKVSNELKINSPNLFVNGNETKLGSEDAKQPIIRGDDLVQFLESMLSQLSTAANAFTTDKPGGTALQAAMTALKGQLNLSTMKSKTVKTV